MKPASQIINLINIKIAATPESFLKEILTDSSELISKLQAEVEAHKQAARYETDVAAQAIADFEAMKLDVEALRKDAEWIPMSERLPKDGDSVFVFSKYGKSDMADFISGAFENCWLIDDAEDTITHWVGKPSKPPAIKGEQAA